MEESQTSPDLIRSQRELRHYQLSGLVCRSYFPGVLNQKPELGSWNGGLGRRSGSELRDYGFLAKSWCRNDWTDLAFSRVKVCESPHLENTFKHLLYLSFPQSRSLIDSFLSLPTVTLLVSAIICLSSGFLQSQLSPFSQSCFSLCILALLCR